MVSHLLWAQLTPTHKLFIAREYTLDGALGVRHQPSDSTTSWFTVLGRYVYHSDFDLLCSLVHSHLALYQVSVRRLVSLATRLPPSLSLLATTCRSLRLAVNTCGWI